VLRSGTIIVIPRPDCKFIHADWCGAARALPFSLSIDHQANPFVFGIGQNDQRV
jgi:hypothetical protein